MTKKDGKVFGYTKKEFMELPDSKLTKIVLKELTHDCSCGEICYYCNKNKANGIRVVYKLDTLHPTNEEREEAIADIYFELLESNPPAKKVSKDGYNKKMYDDKDRVVPICEPCHQIKSHNNEPEEPPLFVSYLTLSKGDHKHD